MTDLAGAGGSGPFALAIDGQHLYWGDLAAGTIAVANFDGTVVNPSLISGIQGVDAIAVTASHIYWANTFTNTIGEANLDGADVNANFVAVSGVPFGLAVDGRHLYWTNTSTDTVGAANLDGTGVDQSFITGAEGIAGLALDGQHLDRGNTTTQTIGEANLDGSDVNESFVTGARNVLGVAVYGEHILWSDQSAAGSIGSAALDGGSGDPGLITARERSTCAGRVGPRRGRQPGVPAAVPGHTVGSLSGPTTLTVTNTGQAPPALTAASLTLTGVDPGDFAIGAVGRVAEVAPGWSCQLQVYFAPQAAGGRSATLRIASNDYANGPLEVPVSGTGAPAPVVSTPPQGPTMPPVSTTPTGTQQPAGKLELVRCKTVSRRCSGRSRARPAGSGSSERGARAGGLGTVGATTGAVDRATISRGGVTYATGTGVQLAGGRSQLVLTDLRPLRSGSYTLTLKGAGRRRSRRITFG